MGEDGDCTVCGRPLENPSQATVCPRCLLLDVRNLMEEEDGAVGGVQAQSNPDTAGSRGPLASAIPHAAVEAPGRYTQVREHARGGMGRILLVHDEQLGRDVVLKELLGEARNAPDAPLKPAKGRTSTPVAARFAREARITGQLEHPSIIPVHELGYRANGDLYYTMKYVQGVSLSEALGKAANMAGRLELLPHLLNVCQAIAYAHSRRVLHRDIKPSNIMVGEFGETVLLDWGLARVKSAPEERHDAAPAGAAIDTGDDGDSGRTTYGQVLGTPAYMAPEQAQGRVDDVDERSDVYGLGALLYTMLTGRAPFSGEHRADIIRQAANDAPKPVRVLEPTAPPELAAICGKAMARDPHERYTAARDLAEELQRYMTGGLVGAYDYRFSEHLWRFVRQNKNAVATAAVAFILINVVATYAYLHLLSERNRAVEARNEAVQAKDEATLAREESEREAYRRTIALAQAQLQERYAQSPLRMLEACPEEYRGWEWRHLMGQCRPYEKWAQVSDESALKYWGQPGGGAMAPPTAMAISPDGKLLATAGFDGMVSVLDAQTLQERWRYPEKVQIHFLNFDPAGRHVVGTGGEFIVWDAQSGKIIKAADPSRRFDSRRGPRIEIDWIAFTEAADFVIADQQGGQIASPVNSNEGYIWTFDKDSEGWKFPKGFYEHAHGKLLLQFSENQRQMQLQSPVLGSGYDLERFDQFSMSLEISNGPEGESIGSIKCGASFEDTYFVFRNGKQLVRATMANARQDVASGNDGTRPEIDIRLPDHWIFNGPCAFSSDGSAMFLARSDGVFSIEVDNWQVERVLARMTLGTPTSLLLMDDGDRLVVTGKLGEEGYIQSIRTSTGELLWRTEALASDVRAERSPGEAGFAVTSSSSRRVENWQVTPEGPKPFGKWTLGDYGDHFGIALAPKPGTSLAAVGSGSGNLTLLDLHRQGPAATVPLATGVTALRYAPDGVWLYIADTNGTVGRIRHDEFFSSPNRADLGTGGPSMGVSLAFSSDSRYIAVVGYTLGTVGLWDLHSGERIRVPHVKDAGKFFLTFVPNTNSFVVSVPGALRFYNVGGSAPYREFKVPGMVWEGQFDASGKRLVVTYSALQSNISFHEDDYRNTADRAAILDLDNDSISDLNLGPMGDNLAIAINPSGDQCVVLDRRQDKGRLFRLPDGEAEHEILSSEGVAHEGKIAVYHPDGQSLAIGSGKGEVAVWNVRSGSLERTIKVCNPTITCIAFSPDGKRMLTTSADHFVRVWDWQAGKELIRFHSDDATSHPRDAAFSPDGSMLAYTDIRPSLHLLYAEDGAARKIYPISWQASEDACLPQLVAIYEALLDWAESSGKSPGDTPPPLAEIQIIDSTDSAGSQCPSGGTYTLGNVGAFPSCSVHTTLHRDLKALALAYEDALQSSKPDRITRAEEVLMTALPLDGIAVNDTVFDWLGSSPQPFHAAIIAARKAVELSPDDKRSLRILGYSVLHAGITDEALTHFREGFEPESDGAAVGLALALIARGTEQDLAEACAVLEAQPGAAPTVYTEEAMKALDGLPDTANLQHRERIRTLLKARLRP